MHRARLAAWGAIGLASVALVGCPKTETKVALADPGQMTGPASDTNGARVAPTPTTPKVRLTLHAREVGDVLDGAGALFNAWSPPEPGAPPLDLREVVTLVLIQYGLEPAWLASLDLDGRHMASLAFWDEAEEDGFEMSMHLASRDPARTLELTTGPLQAEPWGDGLWQAVSDDLRLFLRADGGAMEVGTSLDALDLTQALIAEAAGGTRLQFDATDLPYGFAADVVGAFMEGANEELALPPEDLAWLDSPALTKASAVEVDVDFGLNRDFDLRIGLDGPFADTQLDVLGPPATAPSDLARFLPSGAALTFLMTWSDRTGAFVDAWMGEMLAGKASGETGAAFAQLTKTFEGELIDALYVDDRGRLSLLVAANVDDEDAARDAALKVWGDKAKVKSVKVGSVKGHQVEATLSNNPDSLWLTGGSTKLVLTSLVVDGKLVLVMGEGRGQLVKRLARHWSRRSDEGLEADGGLSLARRAAGGCQLCVSVDAVGLARTALAFAAVEPGVDEQRRRELRDTDAEARKLQLDGSIGVGLRIEPDHGSAGASIPAPILFDGVQTIQKLAEVFDVSSDSREATAADCEALGDKFVALFLADQPANSDLEPEVLEAAAEAGREEVVRQCTLDPPTQQAVRCALAAGSMDDLERC